MQKTLKIDFKESDKTLTVEINSMIVHIVVCQDSRGMLWAKMTPEQFKEWLKECIAAMQ